MNKKKIVHNGQAYSAPRAESIEIKNQGVLCGSGNLRDYGVSNMGSI